MEIQIQFLVAFASIVFSLFIISQKLSTKSNPNKLKLPPGPPKLPIIGNMHNLILGGLLPHRIFHKLSLKYGPVMFLKVGELSSVIISSNEAAMQVMKTHDVNFGSRPALMTFDVLSYNASSVTAAPYGEYWRQLRKIYTLELLSAKQVRSYRSTREEVYADLIRWLGSYEGSVVNLNEKLSSTICEVVLRVTVGDKDRENKTLLRLIKETTSLAAGFDLFDLYPSRKWLQILNGKRRKLEKLHKNVDTILQNIVDDQKRMNKKLVEKKQEVLLDLLLKFQDEGSEFPLKEDNIKASLQEVISAGIDTSSTALTWTIAEMLRNPSIMKKAQDEVRKVFDQMGGRVDESKLHELKYMQAVIKETLRTHATLSLPRKGAETCEVDGYVIPTDAMILVNIWAINRNPKYWGEDADIYKLERFLEDQSRDYKGTHFEYLPFGAGRRMCPGMSFGSFTVESLLATLLYHIDWNMPNGMKPEDVDMTENSDTTASMKNDLLVVPTVVRPLI